MSTAYLEWEQKTLQQGGEQGKQELVIEQINHRFGEITSLLMSNSSRNSLNFELNRLEVN